MCEVRNRNYEEILKTLESDKRYHVCFLECLEKIQIKRKKDGTHFQNKNQTFENATYTGDIKDTIMYPELKVSGRDIKGRYETYTINCYFFADELPKGDVKRKEPVYGLRQTIILTTDEIIEKIEEEKERQKRYIKQYDKQIEESKKIFDIVSAKLEELKNTLNESVKDLKECNSEGKPIFKSSLEYALRDYIKYNI